MIIRDAAEEDLPAIIDIYNAATATRTSTARFGPVSVEERVPWFRRHSPNEFPLWVAEIEGQIAGWLSFHEFIRRPAYRGAVEISVYVHEKFRRREVGRALLDKAIADAPRLKARVTRVRSRSQRSEPRVVRKRGLRTVGAIAAVGAL
jgi:phosphinothricin acetyltransferase